MSTGHLGRCAIGNIRHDLLHWFLSLEIPVQNIGISDMFHVASCGCSFLVSGVPVNFQASHRLPNGRIADAPAEFNAQFIPDLAAAHHGMVSMDIRNIAIQYLVCFLIPVHLSGSLQPFVVSAAGNTVNTA